MGCQTWGHQHTMAQGEAPAPPRLVGQPAEVSIGGVAAAGPQAGVAVYVGGAAVEAAELPIPRWSGRLAAAAAVAAAAAAGDAAGVTAAAAAGVGASSVTAAAA